MGRNEIQMLIENLDDQDPMVRENAAYLLGEKAIEARAISLNTLKSGDQIEQQSAILKGANWDAAISALVSCLTDREPWVRGNAADALGKFCSSKTVPDLEKVLNDEDRVVRLAAVDSLGQITDPLAIDSLGAATNDSDWSVRLGAIRALARFSDERVDVILKKAKTDPNGDVRMACSLALTSRTQENAASTT